MSHNSGVTKFSVWRPHWETLGVILNDTDSQTLGTRISRVGPIILTSSLPQEMPMHAVKGKAHTNVSQTEKYLLAAGFPQKDPRGFQERLWLGCSLLPLREKLQFSYQSGIKLFSLEYPSFTGMDPTFHLFGGLELDSVFWAIFSRSKTPPPEISTEFSHKGGRTSCQF